MRGRRFGKSRAPRFGCFLFQQRVVRRASPAIAIDKGNLQLGSLAGDNGPALAPLELKRFTISGFAAMLAVVA
jgi:hypothetical protein